MYRTRFPLDIAYLDDSGRVVAIRRMEPCTSPVAEFCPTYPPGQPYTSALEVPRGYFEGRGIGVGDSVVLVRTSGNAGLPVRLGALPLTFVELTLLAAWTCDGQFGAFPPL